MADLGEENKVSGVFGGVQFGNNEQNQNVNTNTDIENIENAGTIKNGILEQIQSILATRY